MKMIKHLVLLALLAVAGNAKVYDVTDFGARNDGATLNTLAIQKAIDTCTREGGGTVLLSGGGTYVTGTIYLKDYVTLRVDNGTTLQGSPRFEDYATDTHRIMYKNEAHMDRCLIFARDAKSFAIEGHGTIDGNGHKKYFDRNTGRPMLMRFLNCSNIRMRDISLINPAAWVSAWLYCDDIAVNGINIHSRVNGNGDGLDFDGCTRVRVSDSAFDTSDDSICLQTSRPDKPVKDVVISNCTFTSKWAGMRIGLLSRGDIESVTVTNCTFRDIQDAGLKIQLNEGGEMKNMVFSNLVMRNVPRPIFMTFCQQRAAVNTPEGEYEPLKALRNMIFQNMVIDNGEGDKDSAFFLTGIPGHYIENITIKDVQFTVSGGGTVADAGRTPINEYTLEVLKGHWPEFSLVGTLPASGIYCRHMKGLILENIAIRTMSPDARPALRLIDVLDADVRNVKVNGTPVEQ